MTRRSQHYPSELRERAVRMVFEVTPNYDSQWAGINAVAQKLGVGTAETVRKWVRQAESTPGNARGPRLTVRGVEAVAPGECRAAPRERDPQGGFCLLRGRAR